MGDEVSTTTCNDAGFGKCYRQFEMYVYDYSARDHSLRLRHLDFGTFWFRRSRNSAVRTDLRHPLDRLQEIILTYEQCAMYATPPRSKGNVPVYMV